MPRGDSAPGPGDALDEGVDDRLIASQIKGRAAVGVALLAGRSAVFRALGLLGNLVLARLLVPEEFGVVALGVTILSVGQFLADAAVGAALIGRSTPPTRAELRAVAGFQLLASGAVGVLGVGVSVLLGESGQLTAVMMVALPLIALRGPILLVLQRQLAFGLRVKVEATEIVVYLVCSITLAALGLGAWSLVIATLARAATGTMVAWKVSPFGGIAPAWDLSSIRPLLAFGVRFQATGAVQVAQETALTAGIGLVAGFTVLGLWSFAARILSIPYLVFESLAAVAFPAFSRLLAAGDDVRELLERSVTTGVVAVAALMTPIVATAPASVPVVFGAVWSDVALILPGAAFACILAGPILVPTIGYLHATGDAATPLYSNLAAAIVRLGATLPMLPVLGAVALGAGWAIAALVELAICLPAVRRRCGAHLLRCAVSPCVAAGLGTAAGWLVAERGGTNLMSLVTSGLVGCGVFAVALVAVSRPHLAVALATARRGVTAARAKPMRPA